MVRKRSPALVALALLMLAGAALSQLRLLPQDQGMLLEVAGRPVDALGRGLGSWQRLVRRCGEVSRWPAGTARWLEVQRTLAAYSPPASRSALPVQLLGMGGGDGEWLLAEVHWPTTANTGSAKGADVSATPAVLPQVSAPLNPAIVTLRREAGTLQVQPAGVWSGDTGPWWPPVFIRNQLAARVPALPAALPLCLDPQLQPFAGG